jgi:hypothetical protein
VPASFLRVPTRPPVTRVGVSGGGTPSETGRGGYSPGMADKTEKKKSPLAGWLLAVIAIGLLIMLVIGIAVL